MYQLLRKILFLFDAESVHHFSMYVLSACCRIPPIRYLIRRRFSLHHTSLQRELMGLRFRNPVGLAAGFDKNARYLQALECLGFGFVEIGTVTPQPQAGNDRPRLFRLPADRALLNRMGFNNDGARAIASRLVRWKQSYAPAQDLPRILIGGNIGKNKSTPNEDAWRDYETCFRALFDVVDYFVVNVSSPNTPGLRDLQEKDALRPILEHLQSVNQASGQPKPLLLKIAPDLNAAQLAPIIDLAVETHLDGIVCANTTVNYALLSETSARQRELFGAGGISGMPLKAPSTAWVKYICERTDHHLPVIASGGIFTASDAREKLDAGATLVQIWTGFIYEGPGAARNICAGLQQ